MLWLEKERILTRDFRRAQDAKSTSYDLDMRLNDSRNNGITNAARLLSFGFGMGCLDALGFIKDSATPSTTLLAVAGAAGIALIIGFAELTQASTRTTQYKYFHPNGKL